MEEDTWRWTYTELGEIFIKGNIYVRDYTEGDTYRGNIRIGIYINGDIHGLGTNREGHIWRAIHTEDNIQRKTYRKRYKCGDI